MNTLWYQFLQKRKKKKPCILYKLLQITRCRDRMFKTGNQTRHDWYKKPLGSFFLEACDRFERPSTVNRKNKTHKHTKQNTCTIKGKRKKVNACLPCSHLEARDETILVDVRQGVEELLQLLRLTYLLVQRCRQRLEKNKNITTQHINI